MRALGRRSDKTRPGREHGVPAVQSEFEMTTKKQASRGRSKAKQAAVSNTSLTAVIAQNLANMATVLASSGSVLLCLLIVKRF